MTLRIIVDDLAGEPTRALIAAHLVGVHETSPPESVHALDVDALTDPGITLWTAWSDDAIVGMAALRVLDSHRGEIKSMRVDERYRGTGAGRALLRRIMHEATDQGLRSLWLETGSDDAFLPARTLYASEGFVECGPFEGYGPDPLSTFMTRTL